MISELRKVLPLRLQVSTLFLFIMWIFFQAYQPWQPIGHDLLYKTGSFDNVTDLSDWTRAHGKVEWSDDTGYVSLTPSSRLRFNLPTFSGDLLLCSGKIKVDDLSAGRHEWDAARIMVYFEDEAGHINWSHPHNVGFLAGDSDWQTFTTVIEVPSFAAKGWIELAHYGKSGIALFDDISVNPAIWKKTYAHWQMFFGMTWAAMMMWLIINGHFWSEPWGKGILACAFLIVVGVTLPPATMFEVASSGVKLSEKMWTAGTQAVLDRESSAPQLPVESSGKEAPKTVMKPKENTGQAATESQPVSSQRKAEKTSSTKAPKGRFELTPAAFQNFGHAVLFAFLGFIAVKAYAHKYRPGLIAYSLVLFAVSTEVLQLVIDGRLFGVMDLLLDLAGIVVGALTALFLSHIHQLKRLI
jgi:VanZ family protein